MTANAGNHDLPIPSPISTGPEERIELIDAGRAAVAEQPTEPKISDRAAIRSEHLHQIFMRADEFAAMAEVDELRRLSHAFLSNTFDAISTMMRALEAADARRVQEAFAGTADAWNAALSALARLTDDATS